MKTLFAWLPVLTILISWTGYSQFPTYPVAQGGGVFSSPNFTSLEAYPNFLVAVFNQFQDNITSAYGHPAYAQSYEYVFRAFRAVERFG